jgi:hypothetical protein
MPVGKKSNAHFIFFSFERQVNGTKLNVVSKPSHSHHGEDQIARFPGEDFLNNGLITFLVRQSVWPVGLYNDALDICRQDPTERLCLEKRLGTPWKLLRLLKVRAMGQLWKHKLSLCQT